MAQDGRDPTAARKRTAKSTSSAGRRAKPPTMADVAKLAGVSLTTVSFVINNRPDTGLREQTRDRVRAAVRELGYRPHPQAQALARSHTRTIGLVGERLSTPFAGRVISGAHDVAREHDRMLLIVDAESDDDFARSVGELQNHRVDGLIIATEGARTIKLPASLSRQPVVLVNCLMPGGRTPSLLPDDQRGGYDAARLLIDAGHREIALLAGDARAWATRRRVAGFRAAVDEAGIDRASARVLYGDYHAQSGYELCRRIYAGRRGPTGLCMGNDRMALGAFFALNEAQLRIPDDVSVVGYDDQEDLADSMRPGLTTIRLPYYELGRSAASALIEGTVEQLAARTLVACPPVPRSSVAPPSAERGARTAAGLVTAVGSVTAVSS